MFGNKIGGYIVDTIGKFNLFLSYASPPEWMTDIENRPFAKQLVYGGIKNE